MVNYYWMTKSMWNTEVSEGGIIRSSSANAVPDHSLKNGVYITYPPLTTFVNSLR